jgi:hypothetical protein
LQNKVLVNQEYSVEENIMSQKISINDAEIKAFTSTFQHGLYDVFIGCFLLQFAIAPLLSRSLGDFRSSVVFLPFYAVVYLILRFIRKHVIVPRVGVVEFGSWRKAKLIRFNVILFVVLAFALVLGGLSMVQFGSIPGWIHAARFSLIILTGFCLAGYFLNFPRLYIYGVLVALSPLIGEVLYKSLNASHQGFPITFGVSAGLIILTGLLMFVSCTVILSPAIR